MKFSNFFTWNIDSRKLLSKPYFASFRIANVAIKSNHAKWFQSLIIISHIDKFDKYQRQHSTHKEWRSMKKSLCNSHAYTLLRSLNLHIAVHSFIHIVIYLHLLNTIKWIKNYTSIVSRLLLSRTSSTVFSITGRYLKLNCFRICQYFDFI